MREIFFKGAGVNLFEASVQKRFRFLYRYRYIKFAQDGCVVRCSPWCNFVEVRCYHFAWKTLSRADGLGCE